MNTIVRCVPGAEFAWVVGKNSADPNTCWEYLLTPSTSGTDVVERYEMRREPWVVRVYYRPVGRSERLQRAMDETLHRLKAAAEEHAGRTS